MQYCHIVCNTVQYCHIVCSTVRYCHTVCNTVQYCHTVCNIVILSVMCIVCHHSYAGSVDTYVEEEELRYLLPMKEYIAFCDSLKLV